MILLAHHEAVINPVVLTAVVSAALFAWRFARCVFTTTTTTDDDRQ